MKIDGKSSHGCQVVPSISKREKSRFVPCFQSNLPSGKLTCWPWKIHQFLMVSLVWTNPDDQGRTVNLPEAIFGGMPAGSAALVFLLSRYQRMAISSHIILIRGWTAGWTSTVFWFLRVFPTVGFHWLHCANFGRPWAGDDSPSTQRFMRNHVAIYDPTKNIPRVMVKTHPLMIIESFIMFFFQMIPTYPHRISPRYLYVCCFNCHSSSPWRNHRRGAMRGVKASPHPCIIASSPGRWEQGG